MKITFLGTGHGSAEKDRACTSTLIETDSGKAYLLDAGCDVGFALARLEKDRCCVNKIFITHFHEDHVGGLTSVFKNYTKYQNLDGVNVYFPDEKCKKAFIVWVNALSNRNIEEFEGLKTVYEGKLIDDEDLKVTAIRTDHVDYLTSYAYIFEIEGKKIGFTGDLSGNGDFHDFPKEFQEQKLDVIVCEMTHFKNELAIEQIKKGNADELVFYHVRGQKKIDEVSEYFDELPYKKITVAHDGMEYDI